MDKSVWLDFFQAKAAEIPIHSLGPSFRVLGVTTMTS